MNDIYNSMMSPVDVNGESDWDKLNKSEARFTGRKFTATIPGTGGMLATNPIAQSMRYLFDSGQQLSAMVRGAIKPTVAAKRIVEAVVETVNPLGIAGSDDTFQNFTHMVLPSVFDPLYDLSTHKTGLGSAIDSRAYGFSIDPGKDKYKAATKFDLRNTIEPGIAIAKGLNQIGGSDEARGIINLSGGDVNYLLKSFVPLYIDASKLITTATTLGKGQDIQMKDIPVASVFVQSAPDESLDASVFRSNQEKVNEASVRSGQLTNTEISKVEKLDKLAKKTTKDAKDLRDAVVEEKDPIKRAQAKMKLKKLYLNYNKQFNTTKQTVEILQ
jgi:hypothetical protein